MTGFKAVPADADSTKSYQFFRDVCQDALDARAKELGKAPVKFDPEKLKSLNHKTGDGEFSLVYEEPSLDYGVSGLVLWRNHEMLIRGGKLSAKPADRQKESKPLAGRFLEDAVTFTQKIVGKEEFEGEKVEDGFGDLRLKGKSSEAVDLLKKECPTRFDQYLRSIHGEKSGGAHLFDPRFIRIVNPVEGDGEYALRFESRANTFFCEANVNSTTHHISLRSGSTFKQDKVFPEGTRRFHHSCSETKDFLGEAELLDPKGCKDFSEGEQKQGNAAVIGWNLFLFGTASYGLYRSYTKPTGWLGRLMKLPVLRNFGWGMFTYLGYDSIASNFVDSQNPWRKYGSPIAGGVGMLAPELAKTAVARSVGTRIVASPVGQRVATSLFGRAVGGVATKATIPLAIVWGISTVMELGFGDYEASVQRRVTDMIYDEHVYKLHWSDVFVVPLALKGTRATVRFAFPGLMNWGVSRDNPDLKEDLYAQDKKDSEAGEDYLRQVLPAFLHSAHAADREEMLKLLREPVEFSGVENFLALAIKAKSDNPIETIKALRPEMSEADIETFLRKFIASQVQEVAKGLVFVELPLNGWAREIFTKDGILREGETAPNKLVDRWPPPAIPVASPQ